MSVQEYINSPKGQRRIKAIAKEMNNNHRISMKQCMEFAKQQVVEWFQAFSPEGIHA